MEGDASLVKYLGCGYLMSDPRESAVYLTVNKFSDILNKIIPIFTKYLLMGIKSLDFSDFCKIANLLKEKTHLTAEGLAQIREINAGMNTGRRQGSH
jgi:hypothetical protein